MTPNLYLATRTLFKPRDWFRSTSPSSPPEKPARKTEHWDDPVPGTYEYIPGRGWYLIARDAELPEKPPNTATGQTTTNKKHAPIPVKYSKVLKRPLLAPDYEARKRGEGKFITASGRAATAGFFRLDDGIAWVQCWDDAGQFIPGPYKLWCIDQTTGLFRHMLRGDDPAYLRSRANSVEDDDIRSQDSRSTRFLASRAGSVRDDWGSIGGTPRSSNSKLVSPAAPSGPSSRAMSRQNSSERSQSQSLALEEAKERLRSMAAEQYAKSRSRASSAERSTGVSPAPVPVAKKEQNAKME
ncbi:hypothetical protein M011DRAFT_226190 [Sporormia fimetaria CBS 119925]|uniref:Uncharacterized protein n=1 Tax=Sporormia fimetaria CBS 119925 TaxID=1340428 RepID=A0A6A6V0C6_9PLEO|nr:hypothetical protein M011DRAFT_226190 [Sporormia fimetaria CBS 119925]